MKKLNISSLILMGFLMFSACKSDKIDVQTEPVPFKISATQAKFISEANHFGINLFNYVAVGSSENMMLSPVSAHVALSMLLNGSAGETKTQIQEMLGFESNLTIQDINQAYSDLRLQLLNADNRIQLSLANAVFSREGFPIKQTFIDAMKNDFHATVESLDFNKISSLDRINGWAFDNTNGKISKVLNELSPDLVVILMNALYFKGNWSTEFIKSETKPLPFHLSETESIQVPTMFSEIQAKVVDTESFTAVEIPYGRKNFTMVVLIPNTQLNDDHTLHQAMNLTPESWISLTANLNAQENWQTVGLFLPKFKFSYETLLNQALNQLGMTDAFDASRADLSDLSDDLNLYVSFVKQNTFIETNEEGTEAAAVTSIGIEVTSTPIGPRIIRADRPFLFGIREQTSNTLLFMGQVLNPMK
jgi:serpin B